MFLEALSTYFQRVAAGLEIEKLMSAIGASGRVSLRSFVSTFRAATTAPAISEPDVSVTVPTLRDVIDFP
jgi:hypothetical protein